MRDGPGGPSQAVLILSTLFLLVLRIFADNHYLAVSLDDFALFADRFYRSSYFHFNSSLLSAAENRRPLFVSPGDPSSGQIIW